MTQPPIHGPPLVPFAFAFAFAFASALGLGSSACTTAPAAIGPEEPRTAPSPTTTNVPSPVDAPNTLTFGAPCKAADVIHCGTRARISVMVETRNDPRQRRATPCEMQDLGDDSFRDQAAGCVKDDRVYLSGNCLECRQYSIWDLTGIVAEMTDAQLVHAQQRSGMPREPLLRTPDAWRTALAAKASKAPGRKR